MFVVMTTCCQPNEKGNVLRRQRDGTRISLPCQTAIIRYNTYMEARTVGTNSGATTVGAQRVTNLYFTFFLTALSPMPTTCTHDIRYTKKMQTVFQLQLFTFLSLMSSLEMNINVFIGDEKGQYLKSVLNQIPFFHLYFKYENNTTEVYMKDTKCLGLIVAPPLGAPARNGAKA